MNTSEVEALTADPNDPKLQGEAIVLLAGLSAVYDPAALIAILGLALAEAMVMLLHMETPMPEANIASIRTLLRNVAAAVMRHENCCLRLNGVTPPGERPDEMTEDEPKAVCH